MTDHRDAIRERAQREGVAARRAIVDAAIDQLVYDDERMAREAWELVDRLRAECARLEALANAERDVGTYLRDVALERDGQVQQLRRALVAQAWGHAVAVLQSDDMDDDGDVPSPEIIGDAPPAAWWQVACDVGMLPTPQEYAEGSYEYDDDE